MPAHSNLRTYTQCIANCKRNLFVVTDNNNHFAGLLVMDDHRDIIFRQELYELVHVEDLMIEPEEFIYDDDTASTVLEKFNRTATSICRSSTTNAPTSDSCRRPAFWPNTSISSLRNPTTDFLITP